MIIYTLAFQVIVALMVVSAIAYAWTLGSKESALTREIEEFTLFMARLTVVVCIAALAEVVFVWLT